MSVDCDKNKMISTKAKDGGGREQEEWKQEGSFFLYFEQEGKGL